MADRCRGTCRLCYNERRRRVFSDNIFCNVLSSESMNNGIEEAFSPIVLGMITVSLTIIWIVIIAYVAHTSLPANPIELPFENERVVRILAPEGWAFFTRSPREPRRLLFTKSDGEWVSALQSPISQPKNLFGLDRSPRTQGVELGLLLQSINNGAWHKCNGGVSPRACLAKIEITGAVRNETPLSTLCGTVGIALQKPVPWAWRQSIDQIVMPSNVVKLNVSCEEFTQ